MIRINFLPGSPVAVITGDNDEHGRCPAGTNSRSIDARKSLERLTAQAVGLWGLTDQAMSSALHLTVRYVVMCWRCRRSVS